MTQPSEAVGGDDRMVAADLTPEERLSAAFDDPANQREEEEPEEGEPTDEVEQTEETEDGTEIEAEEDDELPPIDAPVSWDAEAKAVFASLPREAQEIVQKREAERERFVQQKSQEASQVQRQVEQAAIQQLAQIEHGYAEHYSQLAQQLQPQRPNPALVQHDPALFYAQQAQYEESLAQQQQLQRLASEHARQAEQREALAEQAFVAEQHQALVQHFPEYLDPTTGPKLQNELSVVARELGYPNELIAQARASDILAMKKAAEWKSKADQLDRINAKKMEKVRSAKALPKVSTPGSQKAPGATRQAQYASDREAMRSGDKHATARVLDSFFQPSR